MASVIAAAGAFNLDDIRAHIREHLTTPRPGQYAGDIEYFNAGQWFGWLAHKGLTHKGGFLGCWRLTGRHSGVLKRMPEYPFVRGPESARAHRECLRRYSPTPD